MLITPLKIWTGYPPSTRLPATRLAQNLTIRSQKRGKEQKKKGEKRRITASDHRRKRACVVFRFLRGTPLQSDYDPEIYGVPQLQTIEEERSFCLPQIRTKLVCVGMICCIPIIFSSSFASKTFLGKE